MAADSNRDIEGDDDGACMCGELMKNHGYASGHAPVSQRDYYNESNLKPRRDYQRQRAPTLEGDLRRMGRAIDRMWRVVWDVILRRS